MSRNRKFRPISRAIPPSICPCRMSLPGLLTQSRCEGVVDHVMQPPESNLARFSFRVIYTDRFLIRSQNRRWKRKRKKQSCDVLRKNRPCLAGFAQDPVRGIQKRQWGPRKRFALAQHPCRIAHDETAHEVAPGIATNHRLGVLDSPMPNGKIKAAQQFAKKASPRRK